MENQQNSQEQPEEAQEPQDQEEPEQQAPGEQQSNSIQSWQLSPQELQFLNEVYNEVQEAQNLADGLKEETNFKSEQIEKAQQDVAAVQNLLEVIRDESDKEDDIRFAVDNALLSLATSKRRLEDENASLKTLVKDRNYQLRMLVIRVKDQDKQIKDKDEYILKLEKQLTQQNQNLRVLQNKVEDEHRFKVVQEQLRQPKSKNFYDESKYVDVHAKDDPFDFWKSNAPARTFEYPGEPQKLKDIVQPKQLWVGQRAEDTKLGKFEYLKGKEKEKEKEKQSDFWDS